MFLTQSWHAASKGCFPRMRGDVPGGPWGGHTTGKFSPHARGCSCYVAHHQPSRTVFPAYAGMFRGLRLRRRILSRFPRMRGDVPPCGTPGTSPPTFSPHTRGCSISEVGGHVTGRVFPAYAGMFRLSPSPTRPASCFPRIRGDVPAALPHSWVDIQFSPHTRGCSSLQPPNQPCSRGFPRMCGDVPSFWVTPRATFWFSPHMRGCSVAKPGQMYVLGVFSAYAGMFRFLSGIM